jgi:hypothetical protein
LAGQIRWGNSFVFQGLTPRTPGAHSSLVSLRQSRFEFNLHGLTLPQSASTGVLCWGHVMGRLYKYQRNLSSFCAVVCSSFPPNIDRKLALIFRLQLFPFIQIIRDSSRRLRLSHSFPVTFELLPFRAIVSFESSDTNERTNGTMDFPFLATTTNLNTSNNLIITHAFPPLPSVSHFSSPHFSFSFPFPFSSPSLSQSPTQTTMTAAGTFFSRSSPTPWFSFHFDPLRGVQPQTSITSTGSEAIPANDTPNTPTSAPVSVPSSEVQFTSLPRSEVDMDAGDMDVDTHSSSPPLMKRSGVTSRSRARERMRAHCEDRRQGGEDAFSYEL